MKMPTGRMWSNSTRFWLDPRYKIPLMKFVIDGNDMPEDNSLMPTPDDASCAICRRCRPTGSR